MEWERQSSHTSIEGESQKKIPSFISSDLRKSSFIFLILASWFSSPWPSALFPSSGLDGISVLIFFDGTGDDGRATRFLLVAARVCAMPPMRSPGLLVAMYFFHFKFFDIF